MARRPSSVCLSVNFCVNRFFSQANGRIATKLAQDGHQVSLHPGCSHCSRSMSRSKVTWYAHFFGFLEWATPSMTVWLENELMLGYILLLILLLLSLGERSFKIIRRPKPNKSYPANLNESCLKSFVTSIVIYKKFCGLSANFYVTVIFPRPLTMLSLRLDNNDVDFNNLQNATQAKKQNKAVASFCLMLATVMGTNHLQSKDLRSFKIRFEFESAVPAPCSSYLKRLKPLTALSGTVYRLTSSMSDHMPVV